MEILNLIICTCGLVAMCFWMGRIYALREVQELTRKLIEFAEEIEKDKERILRALTIVELLSEAVEKRTERTDKTE